jgi:RimJ/RimL family protein N-acetyltransferase
MKDVLPLGPKTLHGRFVVLEPLEERHHTELAQAGSDPNIWTYIPLDVTKGFASRLPLIAREVAAGRQITFVARRLSDGAIVGSTSYLAIAPSDARVEIGATWYIDGARGTAINPEAKYLLLENAFAAHYNRVEFKTDAKNARSRAALLKLGATEEGTLRGHMWMPQGYFRNSVYFSILAGDWPRVKDGLERRLAGFAA